TMIFYSRSTGGFYDSNFHPTIPSDAVKITDAKYQTLLKGQETGQIIQAKKDGYPALKDIPAPTQNDIFYHFRAARDALLTESDWLVQRHNEQLALNISTRLTDNQYSELLTYRQSLRDWPNVKGWPEITIPAPPNWM
ncbi:phage tail protein, partial [Pseudodesulfovibrio sp. JC047]|uniref:phage tail assembly chaperone n=1 Tax=Pseudodesulfovibrio sp. JC047 TaxID=2683199 RepID=UPI0013D1F98E